MAMIPTRTILLATDFTPAAEEALHVAEALASSLAARLVVLHVLGPSGPAVFSGRTCVRLVRNDDRERRRDALHQLQATDSCVPAERRLVDGDPACEIVRVAKQIGAEQIVLGTRNRTGLERLALGSVADQVMRRAPCSVVTVSAAPSAACLARHMQQPADENAAVRANGIHHLTEPAQECGYDDLGSRPERPNGLPRIGNSESVGSSGS